MCGIYLIVNPREESLHSEGRNAGSPSTVTARSQADSAETLVMLLGRPAILTE
jgi:hypothetical protein